MAVRTMVQIDEELCDGCGLCVPGCAEGALQIIDGKAKLVSDIYCDGLGACLGECPLDAITMVEREAENFDVEAVNVRLEELGREPLAHDHDHSHHSGGHGHSEPKPVKEEEMSACGCPSTLMQSFDMKAEVSKVGAPKVHNHGAHAAAAPVMSGCPSSRPMSLSSEGEKTTQVQDHGGPVASRITNWPIQLTLVPPKAPYFDGADLVIAADCAPFSYGDFHKRFLEGKTLLIGCPKLDNLDSYITKLTTIFSENDIKSVGLVYMEVPCCSGLVQMVKVALEQSGKQIPVMLSRVGIKGDFVEERALDGAAA